nr:hypothetical protein [Deltaproteobacteria bacterium]
MSNEDDEGVGFDLSAWEAPPPRAGLADDVVSRLESRMVGARVRAPEAAVAVEPEPPSRKRWWIAGGVAAAVAAITAMAFGLRSSGVESSTGAVATAKPSHLELGGTAVDLEANTDVWWVRDGKRVVAMQPRGTAMWKVPAADELVINAGATVASVSASGASLRVEVEMNLSDARLIGTSAVTAAAVALVTVIVYEGQVRVTSADKTVEVAAGSTVEITPNKPPVEPDRIAGLEKRLQSEINFLKLENELLRKQVAGTIPKNPDVPQPGELAAFHAVMATLVPAMRRCGKGTGLDDHFDLEIVLHPNKTTVLGWNVEDLPERFAKCVDDVVVKAKFPATLAGSFDYTLAVDDKVATARRVPTPDPKSTND